MGKRGEPIAAVVGIGEVPTGKYPERSALEAAAQVSRLAVSDSGIDKQDIDVIMTTGAIFSRDFNSDLIFGRMVEELGLSGSVHSTLQVMSGGASGSSLTKTASALVNSGLAKNVLCVHSDKLATGIAIEEAIEVGLTYNQGSGHHKIQKNQPFKLHIINKVQRALLNI